MLELTSRSWRVIATAFCFLSFGIGGTFVLLLISPLLLLLVRDHYKRQQLGKQIVSHSFYMFILLMRAVGVMTFDIRHAERLQQGGQLILANHPSLIDTIFLIAFARNADCVVKGKLLSNPFTSGPIRMSGYIANNSPEQVIRSAGESFARGNNLIMFPEGTRTTAGQPIELKRGAANIAIKTGAPIRPVVIRCEPAALTKEIKWYQVPARRVHITLDVMPMINTEPYLQSGHQTKAARHLTADLQQYFNRALAVPAVSASNTGTGNEGQASLTEASAIHS